ATHECALWWTTALGGTRPKTATLARNTEALDRAHRGASRKAAMSLQNTQDMLSPKWKCRVDGRRLAFGFLSCKVSVSSAKYFFAATPRLLVLMNSHFSPFEYRHATSFIQISGGRVAPGHCDRDGGAARLERRSLALELHPLCLLAERSSHRCARRVASASVDYKPADRGGTSHHRQSALDHAGDHGGSRETHRDIRTPAESSIRT